LIHTLSVWFTSTQEKIIRTISRCETRENKMLTLKKCVHIAVAVVAMAGVSLFATAGAQAQDKFPDGPVIIQVPFAPGGGADRTFRLFAPYLSEELGVPVKVTNVAGGGGWVSWGQVTGQYSAYFLDAESGYEAHGDARIVQLPGVALLRSRPLAGSLGR
jgi:hypothetical protein